MVDLNRFFLTKNPAYLCKQDFIAPNPASFHKKAAFARTEKTGLCGENRLFGAEFLPGNEF